MLCKKPIKPFLTAIFLYTSLSALAAVDTREKQHGSQLFAEKGCAHCHGSAGIGGGDGPDLSTVRKRLKPSEIEHQIKEGGKSMPAFGDSLAPDEVEALVRYLQTKRKPGTEQKPLRKPAN